MTLTLVIASSRNVAFSNIYLERFWGKKILKFFWPVFMAACFLAPMQLIYRLQNINRCNINPYYYQNNTIYIQYLPSRLFLCLGLHFENKFSKPGFKQKTEKLNASKYLRKVMPGFDDVIEKSSSKRLFQKLHFKLTSLVMRDNFAIVICHSNNLIPLVVSK